MYQWSINRCCCGSSVSSSSVLEDCFCNFTTGLSNIQCWEVAIAGVQDGWCGECSIFNGTHIVPLTSVGGFAPCGWTLYQSPCQQPSTPPNFRPHAIGIFWNSPTHISLSLNISDTSASQQAVYSLDSDNLGDCRDGLILDFQHFIDNGFPAGCTDFPPAVAIYPHDCSEESSS